MAMFKRISVLIVGVSSISLVRREGNVDANGFTSIVNLGMASAPEATDGMDSPGTHGMEEVKGKGKGLGTHGMEEVKGKGKGKVFEIPKPGSGCATGSSPVVVCMFRANANITHVYYNDIDFVSKSKGNVLPSNLTDYEHLPPGLLVMIRPEDIQKTLDAKPEEEPEVKPEVFRNGGEGNLIGVSFEDVPGAVLAIGADASHSGKSGSDTCDNTALAMMCIANQSCSKWNFWSASTSTVRSFGHTEKSGKKPTSSMGQDDPIDGHWYKRDFDDNAWGAPCESKSDLTPFPHLKPPHAPVDLHPQKIWGANRFSYFRARN